MRHLLGCVRQIVSFSRRHTQFGALWCRLGGRMLRGDGFCMRARSASSSSSFSMRLTQNNTSMSKRQPYPSDLTDGQWNVIQPLLPKRRRGKPERPPEVCRGAVLDAIFYILRTGCQWRQLPHDFPPWGTVASQF